MKNTISYWGERFIKYVVRKTAKCTDPEGFATWFAKFKEEHVDCKLAKSTLYRHVRERLERIEEVTFLNTLEKVQVLFVLSRPIKSTFKKLLLQNKCRIELDEAKRIQYFSSADRKFKLFGDHNAKFFLRKQTTRSAQPDTSLIQKPPTTSTRESTENDDDVDGTDDPSTSTIKEPTRKEVSIRKNHSEDRSIMEEPMDEDEHEKEREEEERRLQKEIGKVSSSLKRRQKVPETVSAKRSNPSNHISALKLAEQVEDIADSFGLHDLQLKASEVVQELEMQNKTICPRKFHRAVAAVWALVDDEKVKKHEGESVDVKKFFKSLRLSLIRPLGRELVANTLVYIDKKVKQFEEENNQEVLSMELIKEHLGSLLELAINN